VGDNSFRVGKKIQGKREENFRSEEILREILRAEEKVRGQSNSCDNGNLRVIVVSVGYFM
jgi:hypothetical protein